MELLQGGELYYPIVQKGRLNEWEAKVVVVQVVDALAYLHEQHVIHRDLKPENILIHSSFDTPQGTHYKVKLVDFGLSKLIRDGLSIARTFVGTPQYWAPEVLVAGENGSEYDYRVDIWSLGILLYVMLAGSYPFDGGQKVFQI